MTNIVKPALLIVDVQNDFCPGGALAVPNGDQVIEHLNRMAEHAKNENWLIIASRDWHPRQTAHFKEFGGKWPVHCVQNTYGSDFHSLLHLPLKTVTILKGMSNQDDGYSPFEGLYLRTNDWPLSMGVLLINCKTLYIGGLATDYCVKAACLDARKLGYITYLLLDACRAVDINPGDGDKAIEEMRKAGVIITTTKEVLNGI